MNIYEIAENLRMSGKVVFSNLDFQRYASISLESVPKYILRMKQKKIIYNVERGKFSISNDPFITASQIVYPSYISFLTGLYLNNLTDQTVNKIFIASSVRRNSLIYNNMEIVFVYVEPHMMFGYKKIKKENSYIMLGEPEKIIIDMLYKPQISGISPANDILKEIDLKRLYKLLSAVKKESIKRRLAYLLDYNGIDNNIEISSTVYKLNPYNEIKGKFKSRWKIYDNEVDC
ncbi:MAG: type IV toxin-antitoxin system AbiEi family antitoxin domain-containing protein [Thermoplasmataceae archaeon]